MKKTYFYTTMTGTEETDDAFFKKLDGTGIKWRSGDDPSAYTTWRPMREFDIVLGYNATGVNAISSFIPRNSGCVFKAVSAEKFIAEALKMARKVTP